VDKTAGAKAAEHEMSNKAQTLLSILVIAIFALLNLTSSAEEFSGKVAQVVKGDVLVVTHGDKTEAVRLAGVDSPELAQHFGPEAKKFTESLALNKEVTVSPVATDGLKRTIALVKLTDGTDLNSRILDEGMGWFYEKHPTGDAPLSTVAAKAIKAKKGLWSDTAPLAPWDFRGDARKERETAITTIPAEPKKEIKTVSAKGNLEGAEREVFQKSLGHSSGVSKILENPIAKQLGVGLHKGANGQIDGIQAQNLSNTPAAFFGFQDGDILSSVNGQQITSEDQIMDMYNNCINSGAKSFDVGVIRNGQPQNLKVDLSKFMK
jgi:endonuclease YncB( thermonuclease family)